jgi:hypothetical protein
MGLGAAAPTSPVPAQAEGENGVLKDRVCVLEIAYICALVRCRLLIPSQFFFTMSHTSFPLLLSSLHPAPSFPTLLPCSPYSPALSPCQEEEVGPRESTPRGPSAGTRTRERDTQTATAETSCLIIWQHY